MTYVFEPFSLSGPNGAPMPTNRNILYLVIGALAVVAAVLGYNLYQDRKRPQGLQINIGPNGIKVDQK
jgi:RsiW-degrading membrane proteinase PrsW (M82 family)